MKKKILKVLLPLCIISMITIGITYAAFKAEKRTTNVITIGNVNVNLIDIYTRPDVVAPGDEVSKIVSAENNGRNNEYVRIKLRKVWTDKENKEVKEMDPNFIDINFPNTEDWIDGGDGYYYYQNILEPGERASDLLNSFKLSLDYEPYADKDIEGNIIVSAEAIQSDNFKPEIENGHIIGWGNVNISKNVDSVDEVLTESKNEDSNVYFQKDSNKFITIPGDDLFLNFKGLLPGDNKVQNIKVANHNDKKIHLYMYAANTPKEKFSSEEAKKISDELISKCTLEIVSKYSDGTSKTIYKGPVHGHGESYDMTSENAIYLGAFEKDDEAVLETKLHIPEEWTKGNVEGKVDWIFTCKEEEVPNKIPEPPKPEPLPEVKTGDNNNVIMIATLSIVAVLSLGTIVIVCIKRKKK